MKFREFLPQAWPQVVPKKLVMNFAVDAMVEHLQACSDGQIQNFLANLPPGHAKSLLVSVFYPVYVWTKRPTMTFIITTYLRSLTFRDADRRLNLMNSKWFKDTFEDRFKLTREAKEHTTNDQMGEIYSTSVEAGIIGWRAKTIIIDDPESREQVQSDQERQTISDHLNVLPLRQDQDEYGCKILVQQRLREDDATGRYLKDGDWVHLKIPYRYAGVRNSTKLWADPRTTFGEIISPDVFSESRAIKEEQRIGPYEWASQFQQEPAPPEGGIIKRDWMKPCAIVEDRVEVDGQSIPLANCTRFMVVQPAMTKKQLENIADPDWFTIGVYATFPSHEGARVFMLDLMRERLKAEEYRSTIEAWAMRHECTIIGVPTEFIRMKLFMDMTDDGWPIREMGTGTDAVYRLDADKFAKAIGCTPFLKAGRYHVPQAAPWYAEYVKALGMFPNATKVDQVDVTAGAVAVGECIVANASVTEPTPRRLLGDSPMRMEREKPKTIWDSVRASPPLRGWRG